jgi:hypothetical protein
MAESTVRPMCPVLLLVAVIAVAGHTAGCAPAADAVRSTRSEPRRNCVVTLSPSPGTCTCADLTDLGFLEYVNGLFGPCRYEQVADDKMSSIYGCARNPGPMWVFVDRSIVVDKSRCKDFVPPPAAGGAVRAFGEAMQSFANGMRAQTSTATRSQSCNVQCFDLGGGSVQCHTYCF